MTIVGDQPVEGATGQSRLRVLLSAFACDPVTGSEPYIGWKWMTFLAGKGYDIHILTRSANRELIADARIPENVQFHYFELPFCDGVSHKAWWIKAYYSIWQLAVFFFALKLQRCYSFHIIHHLTYNVLDMPGFLWLIGDTSFVWGPVGGGQVPPLSLKRIYGRGWWRQRLRWFMKVTARWNPLIRFAVRRARMVLFANEETLGRLRSIPQRSIVLLETAIDADRCEKAKRNFPNEEPLHLLWLSNVEPRKALVLALEAFHLVFRSFKAPVVLDVVGDGPDLPAAREVVRKMGLEKYVQFHGKVEHSRVDWFMRQAAVFLFSSVQDTSGNVVLEAMAAGTPVVALDHQGAKAILRDGGGVLVPISNYQDTVRAYAEAIQSCIGDRERWGKLSAAATQRIREEFTWSRKADIIQGIYSTVVNDAERNV